MRKRNKLKHKSCSLCKPHKMKWDDRRTLQWKKEDEKYKKETGELH